jgi:formate hydrogenlyase subunit 4
MEALSLIGFVISLVGSPLLLGIITKVKAFVAGRVGPPLLQFYYDLLKLLRKGAVYSKTTTFVFRAGPLVGMAAVVVALALVPFGSLAGLLSFPGDLVLFAYLLGLMRFFTVIAALDTGSSFEGMGASREVQFAALAEPALFVGFAVLAKETTSLSLSKILSAISVETWGQAGPALALVAGAIFIVFLAENARIPVDDPNTHLELTMIHEVMVLDHGGPDLALILYGAALKLWALGAIVVHIMLPVRTGIFWADGVIFIAGMISLAIVTGVVESVMARLRLKSVPQLLLGAGVIAVAALVLVWR